VRNAALFTTLAIVISLLLTRFHVAEIWIEAFSPMVAGGLFYGSRFLKPPVALLIGSSNVRTIHTRVKLSIELSPCCLASMLADEYRFLNRMPLLLPLTRTLTYPRSFPIMGVFWSLEEETDVHDFRHTGDEQWQDTFRFLATLCPIIIIDGSEVTESLKEELRYLIATESLHKCIFVAYETLDNDAMNLACNDSDFLQVSNIR
jgi:hypothetical protein